MIAAITGGTGFIGRKLVLRHLARGDEVRVLSRRAPSESGLPDSVKLWPGDLGDMTSMQSFVNGADVLYHCAGEIRAADRMEAVHVGGTRKLVDAAAGRIGRWVQLSSVGAYGKQQEGIVTEKTDLNPQGIYEVTKVAADELVQAAAARGAFEHVILRPSNVYGGEMTNQSLFGLISMIQRGLFFFIGKPGASANYIHVDNVAEALLLCGISRNATGRVFNLSDHRSMEQFVAAIAKGLEKNMPRMRLPEAPIRLIAELARNFRDFPLTEARIDAMTNRAIYSSARIEQEIGYHHIVSMEEGVMELVNAWKLKTLSR